MEKLDIILLTSVIVTAFVIFIIATYREFKNMEKNPYTYQKDGGPRADMVRFVGRLFEDETIPKKEKKKIYKAIHRTVSDMESDGIYFPQDVKEELVKQRQELVCEYSDLPSPKSYMK